MGPVLWKKIVNMLEINFCDPPTPFLNIRGASEEIGNMYSLQITDGEQLIKKL